MTDRLPAEDCPHWEGCSAPMCPMDSAGRHLQDEPVCRLARELVKTGGYDWVCGYAGKEIADRAIAGMPRLEAVPDVARRLRRAATQPMKTGDISRTSGHTMPAQDRPNVG